MKRKSSVIFEISKRLLFLYVRILFKVKMYGREKVPSPPFIVTSNHASLIDPPLVGMACGWNFVNFMAKQELFDMPLVGAWCRMVGCIPVKRGENSVRSLKEAVKRLHEGYAVGIFPEGTRSADGELQSAKRGIGFLVAKAAVPVVPVYVSGTSEAFPKGKPIKKGTRIEVHVGNPISPEEIAAVPGGIKDYDSIAGMVMDRIALIKEEVEAFGKTQSGQS